MQEIKGYEQIEQIRIQELDSDGILLRHKKTGARVALLPNNDNNKTFYIGFRTPAPDDTGVPHIIEHTVLCGSKKFNVKDPFMELVKGSLNTFLNAMTYPDKTVYPVASTNDTDFHNLVDVYMDAVFHPNIYKHPEIFKQEGWNYHLESEEEPLTYNGVVYNEMKGAFSSPDDVLERQIMHSLYPDTCYANESGGDPKSIPDLSYEKYLDFHRRYYHPSNCYIYLYGDVDMEEYLRWFDEEYLSDYEYQEIDSVIGLQKPFDQTRYEVVPYSVTENENTKKRTYLSYNAVTGIAGDKFEYMAYKILDYALCAMPGAPVKQALLDAGIGDDIYSNYADCMYQPYFSIVAKNAEEGQKDEFLQIIRGTLEEIIKNGVDQDSLLAGINVYEFQFREADYGSYPKGLMYGLQMFDSWLYDDHKPFVLLQADETFTWLREQIGTGYYEQLIKQHLLNNPHSSVVIVRPESGLTLKMEQQVNEQLSTYKNSLSQEELAQLVTDTKALLAYQDEPSDEEECKKIPLLEIGDIKKEIEPFFNTFTHMGEVPVLLHHVFTNKIAYIEVMFDVTDVPKKMLPYLGLLKMVLGYMDTEAHSYSEIANLINLNSGGIGFDTVLCTDMKNEGENKIYAEFRARVMYDKAEFAFQMIEELIHSTIYKNGKRLSEILGELKSRLEIYLNQSGNSAAVLRSLSYDSEVSMWTDNIRGINFYFFISDLVKHFEEREQDVVTNLVELAKYIFRKDNLLVSCTAEEEWTENLRPLVVSFHSHLEGKREVDFSRAQEIVPADRNEGFKTSAQIQYVAKTGNFRRRNLSYSGHVKVLATILNYEYLWNMVRVQGGAYGCSAAFHRLGDVSFSSYRDPNLKKTLEVYENMPKYISDLELTQREMTKYIIGTISGMDVPLTPYAKGRRSLSAYLTHLEESVLQKERDEVLSTTLEDVQKLAPLVEAVLEQDSMCVVGNEGKIEETAEIFGVTRNLIC